MPDNSANWCTIESDPGVFTSLIESFGVKNVEVSEIWSLDDDNISNIVYEFGKVYGLIFLFKWKETTVKDGYDTSMIQPLVGNKAPKHLFFAKQVAHNACATQAILSVLFNAQHVSDNISGLVLGPTLSSFKTVTSSLSPGLKGEAIATNQVICEAHNSFCRNSSFLISDTMRRSDIDDDEIFHFIAYVPHTDGNVYELDGLKSGPVSIGNFTESTEYPSNISDMNWIAVARSAIKNRIGKYAANEMKFNLLAVVKDKRVDIQSKIDSVITSGMEVVDGNEMVDVLRAKLVVEDNKRVQWRKENERRRHNYLPFVIELIKVLAESGKLPDFINEASEE